MRKYLSVWNLVCDGDTELLHNATFHNNIVFKCKFYHIYAQNRPKNNPETGLYVYTLWHNAFKHTYD